MTKRFEPTTLKAELEGGVDHRIAALFVPQHCTEMASVSFVSHGLDILCLYPGRYITLTETGGVK